ncbi:caspase family protein [Streptomyces seoulensis]|nr:caspase family protein [Streptomyces seoulensis]
MTLHALVAGAGNFPERSLTEEERAAGAVALRRLPRVADAVAEVARALAAAGARVAPVLTDPTRVEWDTAWRTARERAGQDPLIVHFCGHGLLVDDDLYLAVAGTSPVRNRIRDTAVEVESLLKDVRQGDGGPVLFLLDVCHAGAALRPQLTARLHGVTDRRTWVVAACDTHAITYGARFSTAAATVLDGMARRRLVVPPEYEHVPVELLAREIDTALARADRERGEPKQDVVRTPHDEAALLPAPILPNPWHGASWAERLWAAYDAGLQDFAASLELDPRLDAFHFVTRATGTGHAGTSFFRGRARQLARMQRWLDDPDGDQGRLLAVTGSPGAGKSALLGAAVCAVHPKFAPLRTEMAVDGFRPRADPDFVAVHAGGLTTQQVVASLHRQLHGEPAAVAGPGQGPSEAVAERLLDALGTRGAVTVAVDALDEAADPEELLREVLLPLAGRTPGDRAPGCRVLIGTRLWPDTLPALHTALAGRPAERVDLDEEDPDVLAGDLAAYLDRMLGPGYPAEVARTLGGRLAHSPEHGAFLTAFLYGSHVRALAAAGAPPTAERVLSDLPDGLPGTLELNLRTLLAEDPWTGPVLTAVAHAAGPGMPLELIHAVALALAPERACGPLPPRPEDTRRALWHGRFYLRVTADGDRRLHRFFHRALAEHLAPRADAHDVLRALVERVPAGAATRAWARADPYLLRHLADHAARAGRMDLDELLADPGYLPHADPDRLTPHLHRARDPRARAHADVYRHSTAHDPRRHDPAVRRDLLDLDAAGWRRPALAEALGAPPGVLARPSWAVSRAASPARLHTLGPHGGHVLRVALARTSTGGAGADLVVTAAGDGRLRRFDALGGRPLPGLAGGPARAFAATRLSDGRPVLVSGGDAGGVLVHDLRTGDPVRSLTDSEARPVGLLTALALPDGARAVTAGQGKEFLVWDLEAGRLAHEEDSPVVVVRALAAAELPGGEAVLLAAGDEYTAMVWDLRTGRRLRALGPHPEFVRAAATARRGDGAVLAVTGDRDGAVLVWNLADGTPVHTLRRHADWVTAVAAGPVGGRCLAVSGDRSGRVAVWDLDTGGLLHDLDGQHGVITRVALGEGAGAGVAVTGCADGRVAVWDLGSGRRTHDVAAHADGVHDVAVGRLGERVAAVSGGADGRAVVWDVTGPGPNAPETGPGEPPTALAVAPPAGGVPDGGGAARAAGAGGAVRDRGAPHGAGALLVAAGGERTAEVRDLAGGRVVRRLRDPERPLLVRAVVAAELPGSGRVAVTGSRDGLLRVWDLADGSLLRGWDTGTGRVRALAAGHPGDAGPTLVVAGGDEGTATVWDPATARRVAVFDGHDGARILALAAVPGTPGAVVSGDDAGALLLWDARTGTRLAVLTRAAGRIDALAAALPDGRAVAVSGEATGETRLWDLGDPAAARRLDGPRGPVTALAAARLPDGRAVVLGGGADCRVLAWDPADGTRLTATYHLPAAVSALAACPAGFVVAHAAGTARLTWNAALGERAPGADRPR